MAVMLDRLSVCLGKKGSVQVLERCADSVCTCTYTFVCEIVHLRACAPVGSCMREDVKRQLIGCQSQVLHLSRRCCC